MCSVTIAFILFEAQQLSLPLGGSNEPSDSSSTPLDDILNHDGSVAETEFLRLARQQQTLLGGPYVFSFRKIVFTPQRKVYVVKHGKTSKIHRIEDGMVEDGVTPEDFIADISMHDDLHSFFIEDHELKFNKEFWDFPTALYHGTSDIESVLAQGIEPRSETRGLNNRSVGDAVFTTSNYDIARSYGDVVKIDTIAMKTADYTPFVSSEPEILEHELIGAVAHMLGVEYDHDIYDAGIDYDTVIVYGSIPAKYLTAA